MDTEEGDTHDPLSLHKYLYTSANPVNRMDPTGHDDLGSVLGALAVGVTIMAMSTMSYAPVVNATTVELHFDEIPAFPRAHHAYILIKSGFGLTLVFRGGPTPGLHGNGSSEAFEDLMGIVPDSQDMGYGSITSAGSDQPFVPGGADYPTKPGDDVASLTLPGVAQSFRAVEAALEKAALTIDGMHIPYHPASQNSNSFADTLLVKANLPAPTPPAWSPGWGHILY